ncbi:NADP-dependent oxidoreductase [Nostoc sp. 'Lobaria pulmonaria (5183) cyanobiont']|uniref:NADP-dependent oxidoreductase n=1 Tax=Nostoc sp. 'Lobaria pulmonaria (5183) cyanobiont' TaxID=1618022 RepID=UPI000CF35BC8|nr:NADP-dependent oxidoreductase [Nostoc sp. 'Lobaria pulmonaria (5183) cyanobiont']AVH71709.1 alcohol dehydrogenase [Nostoc sp. 'Lobaria pulmonaria (5183) cyanobiont']
MQAIRVHNYGESDALTLETIAQPELQPNEVLIRVQAAGVNPLDWKIRAGYMKEFFPMPLPFTPGMDVAGIVEAIGTDVKAFQVGQAVYGELRMGAYAQFATAPQDAIALKPKTLDFVQAASVPMVAMTAYQGLFDRADLKPGQTVLIHAASGGVGIFAVQFAKWKGAHVIGTASAANTEFVRSLGADQAIDYKATPFEEVVENVDVVLDTLGGDTQARSYSVLKPGGILVSTAAPPNTQKAQEVGIRAEMMNMKPSASLLEEIASLLDSGQLKTVVAQTFSLSEARQAQELSQGGHVQGKIVLQINA